MLASTKSKSEHSSPHIRRSFSRSFIKSSPLQLFTTRSWFWNYSGSLRSTNLLFTKVATPSTLAYSVHYNLLKPTTLANSLAHSIHTLLSHHTAAGTTLRWQAFRSLRSSWLYAFSSSSLLLQLQHQYLPLKLEAPPRQARIGFHRSQDKAQFLSALQDTKSSEMSRTSVPQVTDLRMTQPQSMLRSLLDHVADKVVTRRRLHQP